MLVLTARVYDTPDRVLFSEIYERCGFTRVPPSTAEQVWIARYAIDVLEREPVDAMVNSAAAQRLWFGPAGTGVPQAAFAMLQSVGYGGPEEHERLARMLKNSPEDQRRLLAAIALGRIVGRSRGIVDRLVDAASNDPSVRVRCEAVRGLRGEAVASERLVPILTDLLGRIQAREGAGRWGSGHDEDVSMVITQLAAQGVSARAAFDEVTAALGREPNHLPSCLAYFAAIDEPAKDAVCAALRASNPAYLPRLIRVIGEGGLKSRPYEACVRDILKNAADLDVWTTSLTILGQIGSSEDETLALVCTIADGAPGRVGRDGATIARLNALDVLFRLPAAWDRHDMVLRRALAAETLSVRVMAASILRDRCADLSRFESDIDLLFLDDHRDVRAIAAQIKERQRDMGAQSR